MNEETQQTAHTTPATPVVPSNQSLLKDLMIPISIVLAGMCVGAGLYFSGSAPASNVATGQPKQLADSEPAPQLTLAQLAGQVGVDETAFAECMQSGELQGDVQADLDNAVKTGGRGTPWSIVIGPGGKTYPINGALPVQAVEQVIALALSEAAQGPGDSEDLATNDVTPVTADDHIRGDVNAAVKIVEYSDFDCPFCSRFHATMQVVSEKYPADQVAWVYRHFPLEQLHPNAPIVALASECVAELAGNDAFWEFADGYLGL